MNVASKTAIGGMVTALSVVLLMPTALELFVYALPAMAGMLILFSVVELNKKWAVGIYVAVSLLSLVLIPNKEAAILYTSFFGFYPIVKSFLERINSRIVEYILKFSVFNISIVLSYLLLVFVFGISVERLFGDDLSGIMYALLIVLMNVMFVVYDLCLTRMFTVYVQVWQKKFYKLFRFK